MFFFSYLQNKMLKFVAIASLLFHLSHCCTEFRIKTGRDVLVSRTMDYNVDLESNVVAEPRKMKKKARVPKHCRQKMTWKNKYNIIYLDLWHSDAYVDGMNDAGLSVGALLFPGFTKYQHVRSSQCKKAISCLQLAGWILGRCQLVSSVFLIMKNMLDSTQNDSCQFQIHY